MSDRQAREEALRGRMQELAAAFLVRTEGEVAVMQAMFGSQSGADAVLERLIMLAHKICGTASTFEFDDISARAGELEKTATSFSTESPLAATSVARLEGLTAQLALAVDQTRKARSAA